MLGGCVALVAVGARAELTIEGVDDALEETLRAFVTVDDLSCKAPRWWVRRAFQLTEAEVREALETLGYYQSELTTELAWGKDCWQVTLAVQTGERARFGTVDVVVEGPLAEEPAMRALLAERPLRGGRRFTHETYESAKSRMLQVAEDLGYFDASFSRARVEVDPQANLADVQLTLAGGVRYRIGELVVEQHELREELVRRFLRVREGQPFDARDLTGTYRELLASQYFDRVVVTPDLDEREDGRVPVRIVASTTSRRTILLGGGYATDTGPRVRADLRYRRLNDRGHRGQISALVSGIEGELTGQYRVPHGDRAQEWLFAESSLSYQEVDTYTTRLWMFGIGRIHQRSEHWAETNYANYRLDDFEVGGERGNTRLLLLGTNWARKTLTDDPRPLSGYALTFDVRGAASALLSDTDVLQGIARGRHIFPLGDRLRLLSRAAVGWTWQDEFEDLPPSIRFFAGGGNSVRGYDFESIGPEQDGEVVGGRRLITGSVELDVLLFERWSAAVFADIGSAYDDSPDFQRGVGVGVRWYSPLGPLRLDVAHPVDDPTRQLRLHLSLGPDL
jgi:translocation and assembly module TamA